MPQATITYDTAYNRKLKSLLDEMDAKHWNNGTAQYHPSPLGFKLSNFHGDYSGEPSARMMVGGGSHGEQRMVHSGNSPAYPPYMMSSGMLVNSGGARIGIDGAVGGYSFNDFIGDIASVGKEVAPDLIRAYARGSGRKKKGKATGGINLKDVIDSAVPTISNLVKSADPAVKEQVVNIGKTLGKKALAKVASAVGAGRGRSARTAIVKKVMAEKGLSMIEASKYVKAHKLY